MPEIVRNVHVMRALLKYLVINVKEHSVEDGFGCLDISVLFQRHGEESRGDKSKDEDIVKRSAQERIMRILRGFFPQSQQ